MVDNWLPRHQPAARRMLAATCLPFQSQQLCPLSPNLAVLMSIVGREFAMVAIEDIA